MVAAHHYGLAVLVLDNVTYQIMQPHQKYAVQGDVYNAGVGTGYDVVVHGTFATTVGAINAVDAPGVIDPGLSVSFRLLVFTRGADVTSYSLTVTCELCQT
jgi:hypothetical protein